MDAYFCLECFISEVLSNGILSIISWRIPLLLCAERASTLHSIQQGPELDILPLPSQLTSLVQQLLQVMQVKLETSGDDVATDWVAAAVGNAANNIDEKRVAVFTHPSRLASVPRVHVEEGADHLKEVLLPLPLSCVVDVRDALIQCATTFKPLDVFSVSWIARAFCSITAVHDLPVLNHMAVDGVREALLALASCASTPSVVHDVCAAICNNTGVGDPGERLFAFPVVRDAILEMSQHATNSDAAQWLAAAVFSINSGERSPAVPIFATKAMTSALALAAVAQYATTDEAARRVANAIRYLYGEGDTTTKVHFESFEIRDALLLLLQSVNTPKSCFSRCIGSAHDCG